MHKKLHMIDSGRYDVRFACSSCLLIGVAPCSCFGPSHVAVQSAWFVWRRIRSAPSDRGSITSAQQTLGALDNARLWPPLALFH